MHIRRLAICAALVVTTMTLSIAHASATSLSDTLQCGVNPTTNVHLEHDLVCPHSFQVGTSSSTAPITIDLGGYTLTVTSPDAPCRFSLPGATCAVFAVGPVNLLHGSIKGSVGLASVRAASRIRGVNIDGDLWMSGVGGRLVASSVSDGSVRAFSSTVTVEDNFIHNGGISLNDTDTRMAIAIGHNLIVGSPDVGIAGVFGGGGEFQNDVTGVIQGNVVTNSTGAGIGLSGALTNIGVLDIVRNRIWHSGADGIHIQGIAAPPTPYLGGPVTLTQNLAVGSSGYAINAPWVTNLSGTAIVDGGGNVDRASGSSPCVGVVCH
jgi:hypothetical protein